MCGAAVRRGTAHDSVEHMYNWAYACDNTGTQPHSDGYRSVLVVAVLVVFARLERVRAFVVEAVGVVPPRPAAMVNAQQVNYHHASRLGPESPSTHLSIWQLRAWRLPNGLKSCWRIPPQLALRTAWQSFFSFKKTTAKNRGRLGGEGMFDLLMQPYYKAAQYAHKRGWTHQLPFYTQVRGCGSRFLWCSRRTLSHLPLCWARL